MRSVEWSFTFLAFLGFMLASTQTGPLVAKEEKWKELTRLPAILTMKKLQVKADGDEVQKLQTELFNERQAVAKGYYDNFVNLKIVGVQGPIALEKVLESARRLQSAGMNVSTSPKDKIAILEQMLEFADRVDALVEAMNRRDDAHARHKAREFRVEVRLELAKLNKAATQK